MTIQPATLMWSRDGGSINSPGGRQQTATITQAYQVVADAFHVAPEIFGAPGLPLIGDQFPGVFGLWATTKTPQRVSPILWIVEVQYEGEFGPGGPSDPDGPLGMPTEVTWGDTISNEEIDEDFDGEPIMTVNGEPIRGVTSEIADQTLTLKRNFLAINTFAVRQYRRSVNSDTFFDWPPGTARFVGYSAQLRQAPQFGGYWEVTGRFTFREPFRTTADKAWYARVRHEGYFVKVGADIVRAVDDNKEPTAKPVLLKADGTREEDTSSAHWLEIRRYGSLPYNALGF